MASAPFRIEGDGSFYIHGRMWDGVDYGAEFGGRSYGYVTRGVGGERVRFVIERGGEVVFSQGKGAEPEVDRPEARYASSRIQIDQSPTAWLISFLEKIGTATHPPSHYSYRSK